MNLEMPFPGREPTQAELEKEGEDFMKVFGMFGGGG